MLDATYVLPLRWVDDGPLDDLSHYLARLAGRMEVVVVDGSPAERFARHHAAWDGLVVHVPPDPRFRFLNGKVNGVLTGIECASHEAVVLADDDVRYEGPELEQVVAALGHADLVRPQNYFEPLPWHARWDTARMLLNRAFGGDFPGTLGLRRSTVLGAGGYDGDVLFENLELMRTVEAAGGLVVDLPSCFVRRQPPTARHFVGQRVRQAYDEFARPARMAAFLAVLPTMLWLLARRRVGMVAAGAVAAVATAEAGRRRHGGRTRFPASCSLFAPLWLAERAACSWLAVVRRLTGGCPYAGTKFVRAATPVRQLGLRTAAGGQGTASPTTRRHPCHSSPISSRSSKASLAASTSTSAPSSPPS